MGAPPVAPTGIQGLDSVLGGGFPAGSCCLVRGTSGNPEHTFLQQVAGQGLDQGEDVLWVEIDRPGSNVEDRLAPFRRSRDSGTLKVLHVARPGLDLSGVDGVAAEDLLQELPRRLLEGEPPGRVVVESLTTLAALLGPDDATQLLATLADATRGAGGLALAHVVDGAHTKNYVNLWQHICNAAIRFDVEQRGFGLYQFLVVEKALGLTDVLRMLPVAETGHGLRVETARRV